MPGWMLGNILIGIGCGLAVKIAKRQHNIILKQLILSISVIISTAVGILVVKSAIEVVLYSIPFLIRTASNVFAFVADVVVLIVGFSICVTGEKYLRKMIEE